MNKVIHFNIPRQKAFIRAEYLFNFEMGQGQYVPAEIIGISSYKGHAPTFFSLIEGKYLFHYLPINAFCSNPCDHKPLIESCYFNCPDTEVAVSVMGDTTECEVYSKDKSFMGNGKYLMTFDWYYENEICHMINMKDGHYVLVPNHKIIFRSNDAEIKNLPNYKKLRSIWKV